MLLADLIREEQDPPKTPVGLITQRRVVQGIKRPDQGTSTPFVVDPTTVRTIHTDTQDVK